MRARAITFDTDWAPDSAIDLCAQLCEAAAVRATFFVTHDSPAIRRLRAHPTFEVGIHPNFLADSTQGSTVREVLAYCIDLAPEAQAMRTHSLVQSTRILHETMQRAPMITTDVSLFLPGHPNLRPFDMWIGDEHRAHRLVRLPYTWEDDVAAVDPAWDWASATPFEEDGLVIYDFHPIHVELNMDSLARYTAWRRGNGERNPGAGTRTFLESLLATSGWETISAIADAHRCE